VTLPKAWAVYNHLRPGDVVEMIVNDDVTVHIKEKPSPQDRPEG
jgi:bifunctional DNA-binding transcriptional regulator/antitoxin component of YhaV-PrlF toxin-antitoxin module